MRVAVPVALIRSAESWSIDRGLSNMMKESWKSVRLGSALIVLAALVAYHNSFSVPFIFDDESSITENLTIHHLWPIWNVLSPPATAGVGGRPVVNLSLAINYAMGGTTVQGYHTLNLAIHVLAGLTLFGVVRRTLRRPVFKGQFETTALGLAFAVAVLWVVHPLQTEAVTYVSQRAELLMALFYLLTLYCFIRGTESERSGTWFALSVVACLLGVASKEVMVSAPLVVLLYDRTFVAGSFRQAWRQCWPLYVGMAVTWLLLGHLMAGLHSRGVGYGLGVTWWAYAMTECRVIVHYLWLSLWPHPLIFDYGSDIIIRHAVAAAPYALILVLLVAGVVIGLKRRPAVGFVGAWFFATLAPASSVVPVAGQPMAEHRMYLPLAAVVTLVVIGIYTLIGWRSVVVYLALAVGLGFLTVRRNEDYRSKLAIWSDTVAKCPSNPRAHNSLGVDLAGQGKVSEAIAEYAVALRLNPDDAEAHNNLGWALASQGKVSEAIAEYTAALQIKPDYADIHNNLGVALADQGKVSEAIAEYAAALRLNPDHAEAHNNFGVALVRQGRVPEAVEQFEQALRIKPDSAEAHNNLANALLQQGNVSEAIAQYREALRLAPDWPPALYKLAWILATDGNANSRNAGEAVQLAERLCVVTGDRQAEDLDVLAAAYAEVGRFSDAIRVAQKAIELASVAGQQELAQQVQERLKLYQAGRPP